jgi:hypothetical protein
LQPFQQRIVVSLAACASIIVLFDQSGTAARSTAVPAQAAAAKPPAPQPAVGLPAWGLAASRRRLARERPLIARRFRIDRTGQ